PAQPDGPPGDGSTPEASPPDRPTADAPPDVPLADAMTADAAACNATSCPAGCCDQNRRCVSPPTVAACGTGGALCAPCAAGQACNAQGVCACTPASCPGGCCQANGACLSYAGQSAGACGTGGATCAGCASGQTCGPAGACVCNPTSC